MKSRSVQAYDLPARVREYDADMDIMHPLRGKMVEMILAVLPFPNTEALQVLDLGVGTGMLAGRLLQSYENASVVAIDGAEAMLELAKERLGAFRERIEWIVADFRKIPAAALSPSRYDAVVSSYALHHLNADEKLAVLRQVAGVLKPGAWFFNADIVKAESDVVERRIQELRVDGVTARAPKEDERFGSRNRTRVYLDALEKAEQDNPQTLSADLRIVRQAGIRNAEVFWKEYREVVIGGSKRDSD